MAYEAGCRVIASIEEAEVGLGPDWVGGIRDALTLFLNCLWMASSASLMVTPLEVSCCYLESQWEVKINLLNRWFCQGQLEVGWVIDGRRRCVDLPARRKPMSAPSRTEERANPTYHPSFGVSLPASSSSMP